MGWGGGGDFCSITNRTPPSLLPLVLNLSPLKLEKQTSLWNPGEKQEGCRVNEWHAVNRPVGGGGEGVCVWGRGGGPKSYAPTANLFLYKSPAVISFFREGSSLSCKTPVAALRPCFQLQTRSGIRVVSLPPPNTPLNVFLSWLKMEHIFTFPTFPPRCRPPPNICGEVSIFHTLNVFPVLCC